MSLSIDFGDVKELLVTLCLLRSAPNLQQLEFKVIREVLMVFFSFKGKTSLLWIDFCYSCVHFFFRVVSTTEK